MFSELVIFPYVGGTERYTLVVTNKVVNSGVMIPFFPGTGIILESLLKEPESELHGIGSKVESVPWLESVLRAESILCMESVPVLNQGQTMTNLPFFLTKFQKIV